MSYSIGALAEIINGKVVGNSSAVIEGVASFDQPKAGCVTFILNPKDLPDLEKSAIACIITPKNVAQSAKPIIQVDNPKLAFAKIINLFFPGRKYHGLTSPKASIAPSAKIGKNVTVEAFAFIGERCAIGDNSVIRAFSYVDDDITIGKGAIIYPNVTIYSKTTIGDRVIIHAGATIGSDGFGYVFDGQKQEKVPQVGNVVIEDDVEIGAGTTIDRAAIGQTKIGQGTKIDNQVQIAHNVEIGRHCAISAQCGISGSCKIGNYVTMGGSVGIADHVEVGDGAMLGANAGVPPGKKIPPKTIWFGQPARPYEVMRKQIAAQLRASENQEELRALKKTLTQLLQEFEALKSSIKS